MIDAMFVRRILPILYLGLGLGCLFSCKEKAHLANFDSEKWKNDRLACQNQRKELLHILKENQENLKGLGIAQILSILGSPDVQQLYKRKQRFYIYFYETGLQCEDKSKVGLEQSKVVKVRFSALDAVSEVIILE